MAPSPPLFRFPEAESSVLQDPSNFFSPHLLSSPLPTNCFFQNFVLQNGDQPEFIHPYLIKSSDFAIHLCYPSRFSTTSFIYQAFLPDLTISSRSTGSAPITSATHVVSSFDDLSVTLDIPPSLRFFLVRGSPFVTCSTRCPTQISISSIHAFTSVDSNASHTKHTFRFNNNQIYLCYSSAPLHLTEQTTTRIVSSSAQLFSGTVRFAILIDPCAESVLDGFCRCYPVSGHAKFGRPFCLEYTWEKKGGGDLLLLAHPLHLRLMDRDRGCGKSSTVVLQNFRYSSIDGELVGVVGDSWNLKTDPISITWHSLRGVVEEGYTEIISSLRHDVKQLSSKPIATTSSYFYGKAIARGARLAMIAEEVSLFEVIPDVRRFLENAITPWLDGSFTGNGFLHDPKWGGILTKQGSMDPGADFGFGLYNDHHYHLGYFLYAIAVLSKIDRSWGTKYRPEAYSLLADFLSDGSRESLYTRLRCFDMWKLHSWASGLTVFGDGRNQESSSEAINAYYSASLLGLSYGDVDLLSVAATVGSFEICGAETWWHVKKERRMYEKEFTEENRIVGVVWANKRDSGLWFAPPAWKECRVGIQVLPIAPITEVVFRDLRFTKELVEWARPAMARDGVEEGWKGFFYALESICENGGGFALEKIRGLRGFDDGNSLSNLLWWVFSTSGSFHL